MPASAGLRSRLLCAQILLRCLAVVIVLAGATLIAAGCGGGEEEAEGSGKGVPLYITSGRDPTGLDQKMFHDCTRQAKGRWRLVEFMLPPSVDAKREQIIRRLAGRDPKLDIIGMDVIWTAEFSEAKWLVDLTDKVKPIEDNYLASPMSTARYKGRYWAFPVEANGAMLFYRKDLVKKPPKTWEELVEISARIQKQDPKMTGFLWQANQYEGLTVDAMEFILQGGGDVLNEDGTKSVIDDNDGALRGFRFMQMVFKKGITPKSVLTMHEEESRQAFQRGNAVFLRNWPYVYPLSQTEPQSKVKGKVGLAPLPKFKDGREASVLGGGSLAISSYSRHPDLAWEAIQCLSQESNQRRALLIKGNLPVLAKLYDDPELNRKIPYLPVARQGLAVAHPRPITPYYNDVTVAIARTAHDVAAGQLTPEQAVKKLDRSVQLAIDGKGEI